MSTITTKKPNLNLIIHTWNGIFQQNLEPLSPKVKKSDRFVYRSAELDFTHWSYEYMSIDRRTEVFFNAVPVIYRDFQYRYVERTVILHDF